MSIKPPTCVDELIKRAESLAGQTVRTIAEQLNETVPANLQHHKGWLGQLLERALGADATSKAEPDFVNLQIELKTIPIDEHFRARESTYVCTVPLLDLSSQTWETSWVRRKLSHVLWIPIMASKKSTIADRIIAMPLLWQPDLKQMQWLKADWQELTDMICLGELEQIRANVGRILHIRPKAANSRSLCWGINHDGEKILTLPRGFYLRSQFTTDLLTRHFFF